MATETVYLTNGHPPGPSVVVAPEPMHAVATDHFTDGAAEPQAQEPATNGAKVISKKEQEPATNGMKVISTKKQESAPNGAKPISEKKLETNRRNAQASTGPRTEEGKRTSSMNPLKHGLLAPGVITRGDYREDPVEFQDLLDARRKLRKVKGPAEEEEILHIVQLNWRRKRAVRYEVGAIQRRTLGMRSRIERRRKERVEEELRLPGVVVDLLEQHAAGAKHIIDVMRAVQADLNAGTLPGQRLKWLISQYPEDFAPGRPREGDSVVDGETGIRGTEAYRQRVHTALTRHLQRLTVVNIKLEEFEENQIQAAIEAAALPDDKEVLKLIRYETAIGRELDRAEKRLDQLQRRRRFGETKVLGDLIP